MKAAPKKLEEQELTEPAGFDSIMSRPDGLFLVDAIQEGADALFGLDEYTVMDISEGAAILASKDGGLFLQPWHRTQFGDQEIALHSQMKPMKESRYHVTAVHPETGETKDFDVDAVHAKSAAKKAQKKLSDAGLKHVVKTVNFAGETDAENSFWAGDGRGNPAASGADQTQSPGSGN